jgi:GNAT superfamily N-acetyltransferase
LVHQFHIVYICAISDRFAYFRNHNWFQNISSPLDPIQFTDHYKSRQPLTSLQSSRVKFYHALVKLVRLTEGSILLASVPFSSPEGVQNEPKTDDIGAILLWLPPKKRVSLPRSIPKIYASGFLGALKSYGLNSLWRILGVFEANVEKMLNAQVKPRGFQPSECGFVQMLASNPKYAGKGYASALLKWQLQRHFEEFEGVPVILDTSTEQGVRAYLKLGFELLDQRKVATGTDARGIALKRDTEDSVKEEATKVCAQRVMIKMPDWK